MEESEKIKLHLKDILKVALEDSAYNIILCTVNSVNGIFCNVSPLNEEADFDVRLATGTDATNLLITPAINSMVMVGMINENDGIILMYSAISTINLRGSQYGGIPEVEPLVAKINALENLVNAILTALKGTTIPLAPSGTYPFAPLYAALSDITPITQITDLENTAVTHG